MAWPDGVLGWAHMGFPMRVFWLPDGSILFRSKSSGADTEVRPPATLVPAPFEGCSRWGAHWGFPIQVFWLPRGTILFRSKPNGADTEVRPPATLVLAPFEGCFRWGAHGMFESCFSAVQRTALSTSWSFSGNSVPAGRPGGISSPQGPSLSRRLVTGTHEPGRFREKWTCPLNGSRERISRSTRSEDGPSPAGGYLGQLPGNSLVQ